MNGFARTLAYGLAALCLVFLSGGVTALALVRSKGLLEPSTLRAICLTKEERDWLDAMNHRAPEKAPVPVRAQTDDEIIEHIADLANADRTSRLVSDIKLQKQALDERQSELERQWSEYRLAKADLARLQSQLEAKQQKIVELKGEEEQERARWAADKLAEKSFADRMTDLEKARYADQAKLFEQMKDQAWQSLRRFEPREIARYLSLMDAKKAARILVLAEQDVEFRDLVPAIHRAMLRLDPKNEMADKPEVLARLYASMAAEAVLPYLRDSSPDEIAEVLQAMARLGNDKKRAQLLEALRVDDSRRELEVRRALANLEPTAATATGAAR